MPADRQTPLAVKVWGELACFTRPEMKVERVSYPVMTPSAARGVLEAIFWKPQFDWRVQEIQVLKPIRYFSILRNEIASRQTVNVARRWEGGRRRILCHRGPATAPYPGASGRGIRHQGSDRREGGGWR